jgi:hypothetical protein
MIKMKYEGFLSKISVYLDFANAGQPTVRCKRRVFGDTFKQQETTLKLVQLLKPSSFNPKNIAIVLMHIESALKMQL